MSAYYNELDPFAAAWLRNLIAADLIAPGDVDERSIVDVRADELRGYRQCHFFAGIGVWSYALRLAGWPDDREVWTGSCPCQPFSTAGKRAGFADERHLWPAWRTLIAERGPRAIFGEQVADGDGLAWLDTVQADLEARAYAVGAVVLPAAGVGAPHGRHRIFFVANADQGRRRAGEPDAPPRGEQSQPQGRGDAGELADACSERRQQDRRGASGDEGADGREQDGGDIAPSCRTARELADTDGGHPGAEGLQRGGEHGQQPTNGVAGIMGDPDEQGSQGRGCDELGECPGQRLARSSGIADGLVDTDGQRREGFGLHVRPRRPHEDSVEAAGRGPTSGFWRDAEWLYCRDGKWRPVEPGTFPLAHGAAGRVGRLRAYGNAINAEVAAAFIRAYSAETSEVSA